MRKKIILLMMLLAIVGGLNLNQLRAQQTVTFNFNDGSLAEWNKFQGPGAYSETWQITPYSNNYYKGVDNTNCLVSMSYDLMYGSTYKPNDYIVTKTAYQITAESTISWQVKAPYSAGEYYEVVVSLDNVEWNSIYSETTNASSMQTREVPLSGYAGQTLYVGFRHFREKADTNASHICIDDVVLSSVIPGGTGGGETPDPEQPAVPAAPVANAIGGQEIITLTWNFVDGATSYNIYSDGVLIAEGLEANNYTADGLQMATGFCFTVTAVNEVGESAHSEPACATTLAPVPATPENLTATDVDENSITLSWSPSEYATNYDIFDRNYEKVATGLTTTSYTVTGLNAETEYCFMVTATNNAGASQATESLCVETAAFVVPEGPQTYTIGSGTGTTSSLPVHMYYTYSYSQQIYTKEEINFVPGVISKIAFKQKSNYQFTRSIKIYMINTEKGAFSSKTDWVDVTASDLVYDGTISTTSQDNWLEIALDNSFLYEGNNILLCVQDYTGIDNSSFNFYAYSTSNRALNKYSWYDQYTPENIGNYEGILQDFNNQLQFVIEAADNETPAVPANLSATAINHESIKLTWDAADKAKGYNIYNGEGVKVGSTSSTEFTVTGLAEKTEYCFTVKSVRFSNESAASEAACATTKKAPVIFTLNDSYGDGWNGGYLDIQFDNGEEPVTLGLTEGSTASYTIDILDNTNVKVTFYAGNYPEECSYIITVGGKNIYSSSGLSNGDTYEFYLGAPRPENLVATKDKLHYGETTTITWDALDGAVSYNIYNGGEIIGNTEETTYELSNLPANFNPGNAIAVTAVLEDESESGKSAAVRIKVAGSFPLTIKVTNLDEEPLAGASVTIEGYDEFEEQVSYEEVTDENGEVNIENMPMLAEYYYSYSINVELAPFMSKYEYVLQTELSYNTAYTKDIMMELQGVYVNTDKDSYDAGEPIVVAWDGIEASSLLGYNVYLDKEGEPINEALLEETIFVIEEGLDESHSIYVVAVYEEGRSDYAEKWIDINAYGTISGTVTDGINPIKNAEVVVKVRLDYYTERSYTFMTNEEGYFTGNVPCSYDEISATISKFGYESQTVSEIYLDENGDSYDCETIVLQEVSATPAQISNVVAENGKVSWNAEYDNYNVYRKDIATENVTRLGNSSSEEYTDQEWADINNGTYQYGVSTLMSGDYGVVYEEGFENSPTINATGNGYCYVSSSYYSGSYGLWFNYITSGSHYVIMPWQVNPEGASLSFWYYTSPWNSYIDIMRVHYSTTPDISSLTEIGTGYSSESWAYAEIDLSGIEEDMIYIIFEQEGHNSNGSCLDDIKITGITQTESEVVWSENIVKNDANVFTGIADWSTAANWSNGVPAAGESVFIEGDVTILSDVVVNNITIKEGCVTIDNAASLTVEGTLINNVAENLVINDGAQIFQTTEGVPATFVMNIDTPSTWGNVKDGWQFIASPFTDASIHTFGMAEGDYDLYKYEGNYDLEWINYKQNASSFEYYNIFKPGTAYLASYESAEQFVMKGTLNHETSFFTEYLNYDFEGDKALRNFHLLGNPFPFDMDWSKVTTVDMAEGYAIINAEDGSYEYKTSGSIPVGDGFFVKTIYLDNRFSYDHNTVYRGQKEKANSINVIASGKAGKDNVVVNFAGQAEGFDKLQNFNDAIATVYVSENGKNYGIANVDENTTEVELNFNAKEMGNYTIRLDLNGEFQAVTLVDRFTGVETDMLEDEYTFTATGNDNVNRFVIKLVNGQEPTANSQFVYQSGEELILSIEGSVQIVDMLGRVVYSNEHANGDNRIDVSEFNDASYVVRVVNEEGVKVQKIIL